MTCLYCILVFCAVGAVVRMLQKPVFIGGFRSGTTLLINLLGLCPGVAPWFETKELTELLRLGRVLQQPGQATFEADYVVPAEPGGFEVGNVAARAEIHIRATAARLSGEHASGKASHERYPIGHDCVGYSLNEALAALETWKTAMAAAEQQSPHELLHTWHAATRNFLTTLAAAHCRGYGADDWINKTPEVPRFAPELKQLLGPCRVIYMVRNGLEVVASARKLGWGEMEKLAYNWKGLLERTREAMQDAPADYLEIRYENLLRQPQAVLDEVLTFCGLPACGSAIVRQFTAEFGEQAFRMQRSQAEMCTEQERQQFAKVAGDMQRELGYSL